MQTTLGLSNVSFGLNPAARQVLNSVFLHETTAAGLTAAIVHASKILPRTKIPDEKRHVAIDLVYDRRGDDDAGNVTRTTPPPRFARAVRGRGGPDAQRVHRGDLPHAR